MNDVSEAEGDREVPICPSIPSGEQTVWADASSVLQLACNDLRDGELIHAENFNLFAAMSALEIMDPKMDSGMVRTYYSVDEAIEYGAAPIPLSFDKTVDVQRVIDIMDHLLACEATWHKGCSLAQTVFSCLYLLRPDRTSSHALLHSYCRVMRATCNAVVCTVSDTRTNEEEDLFTMTHGLPLKVDGDDKCLTMLHAVEETIARQLRACKATLSKKRVTEDIEPLQNNPDLEEGFCKSLLCRLRFRKHFYHVVTNMKRPQGRGLELAKKHIACCFEELESMIKSAEFLRSINAPGTLEDGMKNETTASGCQPVGFDSTLNSRLSAPTPPRAIETISWKKVRHQKAHKHLALIQVVQQIMFVFFYQAAEYFQKLLHELEIICSYSLDPVFEGVLRFVVEFQKFQPELVARAHLQHLLVQDGKLYGRDSVFAVICKASLLPEVAKNHDIQKNETVVQLGQLLITLLRVLCTNISWQRRKLGKILQDWRIIHVQVHNIGFYQGMCKTGKLSIALLPYLFKVEASVSVAATGSYVLFSFTVWISIKSSRVLSNVKLVKLELAFRKECGDISATSSNENICMKICRHILIWVEEQTYWIASRFLMLGFELDLYSTGEYCMVYWYMYIILIKLAERTHMREMTSNEISKNAACSSHLFFLSCWCKSVEQLWIYILGNLICGFLVFYCKFCCTRKGKKKRDLVKDGGKDNQLPPAILFLQCHVYLAEGLTMMLAALRNERQIYLSTGPFNSEHERFVQHFELLLKACLPDHVSYYSFEETTAHARLSSMSVYNCFKETQRIAKELRSNFSNDSDKMAELRRIEQVAEHNSVALSLISRLGAVDASLKVQFEFSHHPFFATAVVSLDDVVDFFFDIYIIFLFIYLFIISNDCGTYEALLDHMLCFENKTELYFEIPKNLNGEG
ncbi:hypothetical protein H5410_035339 [Solanum commersonii]|uniref:N-alpha-acetyltransferase 35, NatC auxiliary subunit n=1 Tax=Solanum commersonii TaxID=4109 RepID=A0A9J5Y0D3_SOLCO|nr:hypothetical protein H5410_035339 [Solanum commersonii]